MKFVKRYENTKWLLKDESLSVIRLEAQGANLDELIDSAVVIFAPVGAEGSETRTLSALPELLTDPLILEITKWFFARAEARGGSLRDSCEYEQSGRDAEVIRGINRGDL